MSKPQPIVTVGVTQDIRNWFEWASKLVTKTGSSTEWNSRQREKIDIVLASTVYSLVDGNGRREFAIPENPIGAVLRKS